MLGNLKCFLCIILVHFLYPTKPLWVRCFHSTHMLRRENCAPGGWHLVEIKELAKWQSVAWT